MTVLVFAEASQPVGVVMPELALGLIEVCV